MREHHSLHWHHKLIGSNLAKLLNAYFYISHANLPNFVFFISQALNHDRHKLWQIVDESVEATGKEEQYATVCFSDLSIGVISFDDDLFNIDFEVGDAMS